MPGRFSGSWTTTRLVGAVKAVLFVLVFLGVSTGSASAVNWINPSISISHVSDGSCIAGPFANAGSTSVSINWTALNTDAAPGRSIILTSWRNSGGFSGVAVFNNAPVGQLPTQTTVDAVATSHLTGNVMYFGLYDTWDSGSVWSQTRSPVLSPDLTAPVSGVSGYTAIDMTTDPDCIARPEIGVTGNGFSISDGDGFPSSNDGSNFGTVAHISGSVSRTFVIQNTGAATLNLGANAATLSGTHAADFSVTSQPATSVAASNSTSVTVTFDPSAAGARTATLSIANDDSDENPYDFALSGAGAGSPEMDVTGNGQSIADGDTTPVSGDHTNFGSIDVNDGHIERTFTIENTGDATLNLGSSSVTLSGADAADFSVFLQPFSPISAGGSRTFRIRFDPSTAGVKSAMVSIANDDADESPYNFSISGTATTAPEIEVRRDSGSLIENGNNHVANRVASLSFNQASGTRIYTINNIGSDTLTISSVTITGTHAAEFSIVTPPSGTVAPGGSTSVTVRFTQTTAGTRTANLNITNNDADEGAFSFGISGLRFAGPDLDIAGNSLDIPNGDTSPRTDDHTDFGSVDVTSGTVDRSFTGANVGDSPIVISSITVMGPHASDFSVTTGTGFSPITVRFDPSAAGLRTATVTVASDALVDNPFTFAIQGTGTNSAPEISLMSSEGGAIADGGTDSQGSEAAGTMKTVTYTVSNTGTDDLTLATAGVTSLVNVTVNAITSPVATTVTAGNSTTFTVQYTPVLAGAFSFGVSFTNNDGDENPYDFTVSGTGVGAPEINVLAGITIPIADDPAHDPAGSGGTRLDASVGLASSNLFTIENTGTGPLTLGANAVSLSGAGVGDFSVSQQPASTIAPGGSTTFRILFAPTVAGLQGPVDVAITNNDGDENPYNFRVQGTGRQVEMDVTGNGQNIIDNPSHTPSATDHTDFGSADIAVGSVTRTFTVQNNGFGLFLNLGANSVSLSGPHAGDFTVSVQPASSVDVGLTTTFQISFDPSSAGLRGPVDVSIVSDDLDENPFNFRIQGTGTSAPEVLVTGAGQLITDGDTTPSASDHTDFGSADITSGTVSRTFTIENTGSGTLTLGANAATLTGADAGDFQVTSQPAATLAPTAATSVTVQFDPSVLGDRTATLSIANDDSDEGPYDFLLRGSGSGLAEINVAGNSQSIADGDMTPSAGDHTDFGTGDVGTSTISRTFTIQNTGTDTLTLGPGAATVSGPHAADFQITSQPAATLAPTAATVVVVQFSPSAVGVRSAVLSISNDDPDEGPYDFALSGGGVGAPEITVRGNGLVISDGSTAISQGDHTNFGPADVSSGLLTRTFTIENAGTDVLTLGPDAVTLSGSHAADFSITSQPATTVPVSGSTNIVVSFDPSALGARHATLVIANDDSDESPFDFSIGGEGVNGGTVTLVHRVKGGDLPLSLSSSTPALNLTLTAIGGVAQTSVTGVPAGTHMVRVQDMSDSGFGLASISCDGPGSRGDVSTRSATIVLTAGGHVTCTFETLETRLQTSSLIADFIGSRMGLFLSHQPDNARRVDRVRGEQATQSQSALRVFGETLQSPLPVDLMLDEQSFFFAADLKRMLMASGSPALYGEEISERQAGSGWDLWIELSGARTNGGSGEGSTFGIMSVGADYLVEPGVLVGLMVQLDRFKQDLSGGGDMEGWGWMSGPYATFRLDDHLYVDVSGAWGRSENEISPFGTYRDAFQTERTLLSGALAGQFEIGNWDVRPKTSVQFMYEQQSAYTDSLGVRIPDQSVSQGELSLGPTIAYTHRFDGEGVVVPRIGLEGVYGFGARDTYSAGSFASESQGLTGRVRGGVTYRDRENRQIGVTGDYGGIGSSVKSYGLSLRFTVPLQ